MRLVFAAVLAAFVLAPAGLASEQHPTAAEIENEIWCNDCKKTLAEANNLAARDIRIYLYDRLAAGDSKSEIKRKIATRYWWHVKALPSPRAPRTTLADLEDEVMCPVCNTTLDQSYSAIARRMKADISRRIAAGQSKQQIEDALVAQFGPQILAAPPKKGFDLLAWLLPFAGLFGGALVLGFLAWRWTQRRGPTLGGAQLDPALERRVDEELARFDEG